MSNLIFDKYKMIRRLAVGGMGEVFLARQVGIGGFERQVIVKSLLPHLAEQEDFVTQFLDEARLAATLNHPNIVQVHEVGKWQGMYFIAMEFISGGNLSEIRRAAKKSSAPMPLPVIARMIHDAALGLDHAHQAHDVDGQPLSIVHRDVSPQNIMVRGDGVTKVVDFGVAKATNRLSRTATGILKGKYPYMSPEQVMNLDLDGRSDQFSLGILLWELCAGKRLFWAETEAATILGVLQKPIPRLSSVVQGIPPMLDEVAARMLERERELRYPRLLDAARDLEGFLEEVSRSGQRPSVRAYVSRVLPEEVSPPAPTPSNVEGDFLISLRGTETALEQGNAQPIQDHGLDTTTQPGRARRAGLPLLGGLALALAILTAITIFPRDKNSALTFADGIQSQDALDTGRIGRSPDESPRAVVRPEPVRGLLRIIEPEGASVFLGDDAWPEPVPTAITGLAAGHHQLRLVLPTGEEIREVVYLEPPPPASAIFRTEPPGATVILGGEPRGTTPLRIDDLPVDRPVDVALALENHRTHEIKVMMASGEVRDLSVSLQPLERQPVRRPARAAARAGSITLNTTPWTRVTIGERALGTTPIFRLSLPAGEHVLTLENEERGVHASHRVTIEPGKNLRLDLDLSR